MRGMLLAGVFAAFSMFAAGCGNRPAPTGEKASGEAAKGGEPAGRARPWPPKEVTLTEGGVADIDQAAKETKDAVVLVEFWSMATEPSPDLALASDSRGGDNQARGKSLAKDKVAWHGVRKAGYMGMKYDGYFLRVILVNVDGPEKRDEAVKFLKDHEVRYAINFAWKGNPAEATARYGFTGKVPHQAIFARKGERVWATGEPLQGTLDDIFFHELDK